MNNWISVEDELPKGDYDDECIDVYSIAMGRITDCTYIDSNYWETYQGDRIYDVTHWMPLPEPPKDK
jgi:hypothetical protein